MTGKSYDRRELSSTINNCINHRQNDDDRAQGHTQGISPP